MRLARRRGALVGRPVVLMGLALFASACYPGPYPLDTFKEMHYQASQRRLEPERLAPPRGAVPITGARQPYTFEEAAGLQNPLRRTPEALEQGRGVLRVNCGMCHGQDGRGQSFVAQRFVEANVLPPVDLGGPRARQRTDGQLYWLVTNGIGNMPPFGELLTEDERWALVHVIREMQGQ